MYRTPWRDAPRCFFAYWSASDARGRGTQEPDLRPSYQFSVISFQFRRRETQRPSAHCVPGATGVETWKMQSRKFGVSETRIDSMMPRRGLQAPAYLFCGSASGPSRIFPGTSTSNGSWQLVHTKVCKAGPWPGPFATAYEIAYFVSPFLQVTDILANCSYTWFVIVFLLLLPNYISTMAQNR